jgi:hypothetical protein
LVETVVRGFASVISLFVSHVPAKDGAAKDGAKDPAIDFVL